MSKNVQDRRVRKTRQVLREALTELISEKGYESVTVQEILDRANVGRSTFYAHFQDKEQLLRSCFDSLNELLAQHAQRLLKADQQLGGADHANLPLSLFEFAGRQHRFFKALLGKQANGLFRQTVYDYLFAQSSEYVKRLMPREKYGALQSEIVAHYLVSAFMGILVWWVENDMPCPADEVGRLLRQLAIPGFRNVLALN